MKSWMPIRLLTGEGSTDREEIDKCTCSIHRVMSAACQKGDLGNCGISGCGEGRTFNIIYRVMASPEGGEGHTTVEAE